MSEKTLIQKDKEDYAGLPIDTTIPDFVSFRKMFGPKEEQFEGSMMKHPVTIGENGTSRVEAIPFTYHQGNIAVKDADIEGTPHFQLLFDNAIVGENGSIAKLDVYSKEGSIIRRFSLLRDEQGLVQDMVEENLEE